ncbi:hypothetical protein [Alteribacillus sp. YIM 98480]|uniref:hypothetical protein n=1 Tax=Alteribacillus sp. YIM 98480 TaxID=2606599 RepID=UPI00131C195E|nr:hypothetical protein [Alteribacillus sp. YIM 98480]
MNRCIGRTTRLLMKWTVVDISHQRAGNIVKQVGTAQVQEDKYLVTELEEAAVQPEVKYVDYLYTESDVRRHIYSRNREKEMHSKSARGGVLRLGN